MSVIGKKLNPIQASGGHGDENTTTTTTNNQPSKITPEDVLRLTKITDDYLCSSGWKFVFNKVNESKKKKNDRNKQIEKSIITGVSKQ